jgi:spore germination protein GerM
MIPLWGERGWTGGGSRRSGRRVATAAAAGLAAALAVGGCGSGDGSPTGAAGTAPTVAATAPARTVTVWFSDDSGRLRAERRRLPAGADPLRAALAALGAGPTDPALLPALPAGTRVLSTSVSGGVARVDLSREFEEGYPQGSAAELAVIGPIVRTAVAASGASSVLLLVEGRPPAPLGAQLDLSQPLGVGDLPAA